MEQLLNVTDVSKLLKLSPKTIYNWVNYGYIPYIKVYGASGAGGAIRFRESDLNRWIRRRMREGRSSYNVSLSES